jgi:hypothetical protein
VSLAEDIKTFVKANTDEPFIKWWDEIFARMELEQVQEELVEQNRWSTLYDIVVKRGDEFARVTHSRGSTEMQENDDPIDEVDYVVDVEPIKKTVVVYEVKK